METFNQPTLPLGEEKSTFSRGGVPCQPASNAGIRKGEDDSRWLWPHAFRVVDETAPRWCVFENVGGLLTLSGGLVFERLCSDLEGKGYEVQSFVVPACAVGACHRRNRVWIIAHATRGQFREVRNEGEAQRPCSRDFVFGNLLGLPWNRIQSESGWRDDGISERLDGITFRSWRARSLAAYGNAIVPQVAWEIFNSIDYARINSHF